jgi:hypothetical protein
MDKSGEQSTLTEKRVPLKRTYPPDLQSHFVMNIVVQHQPDYFVLSFFEIWPPPVLGETDEDRLEEIEQIEEVEARCVARLVVTPEKMRDFIGVMSTNFQNWEAKFATPSSANLEE